MKLHNRQLVEGTMPNIYIGHRDFRDRTTGQLRQSLQWYAEYNHLGKRHAEALKTTNKAAAIRAAHRIVERIEKGEVLHVHRRTEWDEMYQAYISFVRSRGRGPKTLEKYTYVLTAFIEFAKARKRSRPETIGPADFWAFSEQMRMTDKLHRKTTRDRLIIVKQMFKWAATKAKPKMLRENPIENEDVPDTDSSIQPCFDPDQVEILLKMADKHHAPIYAVMAYLGLRFGEVRDLMWSDFDFNSGHFGWVTISKGGSVEDQTKGKNMRRIPVSGKLRKFLDDLPRHEDGLLFHQQPSSRYPKGDRPLSERRLLKSLKRLCRRAKFYNPQQYKLHTFRHAFASMLARSHIAFKQALAWMGHTDSKILNLYIKLFDNDAQEAMKAVDYSAVEKKPAA